MCQKKPDIIAEKVAGLKEPVVWLYGTWKFTMSPPENYWENNTDFSDGNQACRFDKIDSRKTLIINDIWDYNSLLWGIMTKR